MKKIDKQRLVLTKIRIIEGITMKSIMNNMKAYISLWRMVLIIPIILMSGCVKTIFSVQFPEKGETYIGNELVDFIVKYDKTVTRADIFLNGVAVGNEFKFGATSAKASITDLKKYLKQGTNTLTVDPLAFGPTVQFVVDNAGPEIIITKGKTTGASTLLEVEGELRDPSGIYALTMRIDKVTNIDPTTGAVTRTTSAPIVIPVDAMGRFRKTGIAIDPAVSIYRFEAEDVHGQSTVKEFLADSNETTVMSISNAIRVAIGDSFIESLRPIIASQLYNSLQTAPIDIQWQCWNDPNKTGTPSQNPNGGFCGAGQDGATFNSGLNPVTASLLGIPMTIYIKRINMQPNKSTVLLNKFKMQANNYLKIDMIITEMLVSLRIDLKILFISLSVDPMTMTIGRIGVDTGAYASAVNKKVNVQLADSNFSLSDITVSQTSIGGINIGGLVNIIMPLIEGIIGDLLPGILNPILNDNLQKIVIGSCIYPKDNVTSTPCNHVNSSAMFNWAANVETLKTDNLFGAAAPYDMIVGLQTQFNLLKADPFARPSLGAVYVEDPVDIGSIYNSKGETGTNLTVAVSSNALNQAFSALYQSGLTHIALVDGVMTNGADPSKPVGTNGKTRIRLYPESPPFFRLSPVSFTGTGAAVARVGYESAYMYLDKNENGVWKEQLKLGVDFDIAANIAQVGNAVRLGVEGSPTFNLRSMENNTGFPVTQAMLQGVLDLVTMYFLPQITDRFVIIDLAQLANTSLNGTKVLYQTDQDSFAQTINYDGAGKCTSITNTSSGGDGTYDYTCETINFVVNTNTLTSTGSKGTNLLFQMEARDPDIPPAPAIPRLDLDGDGVLDYKDNCSVPILMQVAAIKLEGGLVPANIDSNGDPVGTFVNRIKAHINRWVAAERGQTGFTPGDYFATTPVAGSGTPAYPISADIAWWNYMRKGDDPANINATYPWIDMIYSNKNQRNTDGDGVGELCEDDSDRDTIYYGNGAPTDTCPKVYDITNSPGSCTIDDAAYVLFQNQQATINAGTRQCLSHTPTWGAAGTVFTGTGDANVVQDFSVSNTYGATISFKQCDASDITQRFYVGLSTASDTNFQLPANKRPFCGATCKERIVNIYTNPDKQISPGFYDDINQHYLATTIKNFVNGSAYWGNDDVITTTMSNYDGVWREWILSLVSSSSTSIPDYPFLLESWRVWEIYGRAGGIEPGRRDCIYQAAAGQRPNLDNRSCSAEGDINRQKAAFKVLLGAGMVEWTGNFKGE